MVLVSCQRRYQPFRPTRSTKLWPVNPGWASPDLNGLHVPGSRYISAISKLLCLQSFWGNFTSIMVCKFHGFMSTWTWSSEQWDSIDGRPQNMALCYQSTLIRDSHLDQIIGPRWEFRLTNLRHPDANPIRRVYLVGYRTRVPRQFSSRIMSRLKHQEKQFEDHTRQSPSDYVPTVLFFVPTWVWGSSFVVVGLFLLVETSYSVLYRRLNHPLSLT